MLFLFCWAREEAGFGKSFVLQRQCRVIQPCSYSEFFLCTVSCFYPGRSCLPSLSHDLELCAGCRGDPREKDSMSKWENPEKLNPFVLWMKPIRVMSLWTDANRLSLLAWAWLRAKRPSQQHSEQDSAARSRGNL